MENRVEIRINRVLAILVFVMYLGKDAIFIGKIVSVFV